jgi:predicted small integral membrane protein
MSTPDTIAARSTGLRTVRRLVGAYVVLSLATVATIVVLSKVSPGNVNPQAWVRGIIVAGTSLLTLGIARRASPDQPRTLLRLRLVLIIILLAVVGVLFFVALPAWMRVEQGLCGVILLGAAVFAQRGSR